MTLKTFISTPIGAFIIILPYIKPAAELMGSFDIIFDIWKLISALLIIIGCGGQMKKISKMLIPIMLIQIVFFTSTILHHGDLKVAIVQVLSNISICLYFDFFIRSDSKNALKNVCYPIITMTILTALTMFIFYPNGMYSVGDYGGYIERSNYIWGFDNSSIFNFIPGMFFLGMYSFLKDRKNTYRLTTIIYIFISLAFLYVFSITAFLGCFTITIVYIFLLVKKFKLKLLTIRNVTIFVIVISLVLFALNDNLTYFMKFATKIGKFYSVRARFVIWNLVVKYWGKSPIWGYGIEPKNVIINKLIIDHPHNYFMDIIYRGGLAGLCCVVWMFIKLIKGKWINLRINNFVSICFFVLFIMAQMDFYNDRYLFYPLIILIYHSKKIICNSKFNNKYSGKKKILVMKFASQEMVNNNNF